jgi:hypothetical protein
MREQQAAKRSQQHCAHLIQAAGSQHLLVQLCHAQLHGQAVVLDRHEVRHALAVKVGHVLRLPL